MLGKCTPQVQSSIKKQFRVPDRHDRCRSRRNNRATLHHPVALNSAREITKHSGVFRRSKANQNVSSTLRSRDQRRRSADLQARYSASRAARCHSAAASGPRHDRHKHQCRAGRHPGTEHDGMQRKRIDGPRIPGHHDLRQRHGRYSHAGRVVAFRLRLNDNYHAAVRASVMLVPRSRGATVPMYRLTRKY